MFDFGYSSTVDMQKFQAQLLAKYSEAELKLLFAEFIVSYFQKRNRWSGKKLVVHSVLFSDVDIMIRYSSINGWQGYKRLFYERHINEIVEFINNNIINMDTKHIHDTREYNNVKTITDGNNIVVIKYAREGFTPLQSMTVGDYYVAKKTVYGNKDVYELMTHDMMDRSGTEPIRVNKYIDGGNGSGQIMRFEEYEIKSWVEWNDFNDADILLCPVLSGAYIMVPTRGKLSQLAYQLEISKKATRQQVFENLRHRAGRTKLLANSGYMSLAEMQVSEGLGVVLPGKYSNLSNVFGPESMINIHRGNQKAWEELSIKVTKSGREYHAKLEKMFNGTENDEDIEQRLNSVLPQVKRHKCDVKMGVNDDYLLI